MVTLRARIFWTTVIAAALSLSLAAEAEILAESHFEAGVEGWFLVGDPTTFIPILDSTGNPGGCIKAVDSQKGVGVKFMASPAFLGNKAGAYGGLLEFDEKRSSGAAYDANDVLLYGGEIVIVIDAGPSPAVGAWTHYAVGLDELSGWKIDSLDGPPATREQIQAVLTDLDVLQVRGEFSSSADSAWLDNVVLSGPGICHIDGDINNDGVVNLLDLGIVLSNFLLSCP